mmetsp:Transcript_12618/g.24233  ORF Transcript_12618/g.24233 Transcript_12618/m.24233 type:complete len:326 (+) Transcript_12618:57-1034(+)
MKCPTCCVLLTTILLLLPPWLAGASSSTISSPPASLPRSKARHRWSSSTSSSTQSYPPWNTSPHIRYDGFLRDEFRRIPGEWEEEVRLRTRQRLETKCRIRQVPGDGNCLFHSISLCLQHATNGTHWDVSKCLEDLYTHSQTLRQQAVDCLRQPHKRLFLQGRETLKSGELVQAAAQQYGLTSEEYCQAMEQDCVWGGGPEIVALSNLLQRPIHVYELATSSSSSKPSSGNTFVLRRMACFGSPRFDRREALHILSADSRFPDLLPGEQLSAGNHFLAVFPLRPRRLRGGGGNDVDGDDDAYWIDFEATEPKWSVWKLLKHLILQ